MTSSSQSISHFDAAAVSSCRDLIVVAGHAVLLDFATPEREASWSLLSFQRGEVPCYLEHIECGVRQAARAADALLVFAGGQSRHEAGPRSEAEGYYWAADRLGWFGHPDVAQRAALEDSSRDSFENLLFSLCRFRECTGRYPRRVSFVSWAFKQKRFALHREAIRWPAERFEYLGPNNPPELEQALRAETLTTQHYEGDPYSAGDYLSEKRASRNPFRRQHGYSTSCPELERLFQHRGPERFAGPLPWG